MSPTGIVAATWVVFVLVYVGLAVGKLPMVHLDRAGIALVGATAALVLGMITFPQAVESVDFATIALLFGMMVVVAYLRLGGFFRGLATRLLSRAKTPVGVLAARLGPVAALGLVLVFVIVAISFRTALSTDTGERRGRASCRAIPWR